MKPTLLKINPSEYYSFSIRHDVVPYFYDKWHYHPEAELIYIKEGNGTQFIGDSIERFKKGDILLIGSNLPHYWRCDDNYFQNNPDLNAEALVSHFLPNFWSDTFINLPENKKIKELLITAKRGIYISKEIKPKVISLMKELVNSNGELRIILLLTVLHTISEGKNNRILSSVGFDLQMETQDKDNISKIYAYCSSNFKRKITLEEIADIANVSPNSFCRYFKTKTRKRFSDFLKEIRVGYACKLLIDNKLSVTQVCYESGFNNLTNFYKCFKSITGKTPFDYQKNFENKS
ncbi:AraC family transcriptional regulator [Pedobacter puniceum]|uniref:Helix-turn-helix domain-containing protein n=1 Tax=Pedobacter puniceum TaxID=2666136 RepID=A0A7K0FPC6_9SPHI|nr:helix-turn-helix domain-containing protein [Pedobacter puniceum]MRX46907.1 helix-turn-helix domain-containing protein [Pedobacter puniceum]